jgi:two-component system, NtrC family, response regulator HydG
MSSTSDVNGYSSIPNWHNAIEPVTLRTRDRIGIGRLLGACEAIQIICDQIRRVAPTRVSVLITGESGTGKDLVARAIHRHSGRKELPYVAVNCGAIPEALVEAELFGYEKGSFTGAIRSQAGYFERAGRGTLFLDEIGEMPIEMQVKLLRALESGFITRIGGNHEIPVQARVLAATNRSPSEAVAKGLLRSDLLYRLAVFHIVVPALRERGSDVSLLARHFLNRLNRLEGTRKQLSADSMDFLRENTWPGNVRELHNVIQRGFILADDEIDLRAAAANPRANQSQASDEGVVVVAPGSSLADVERMIITETLKSCGGNKTRAAAVLGISLKTLYNRLNEYRTKRE